MENPQEVIDAIREHLTLQDGRELHVEYMEAVYDWTSFFEPCNFHIKGLDATAGALNVNHAWRVVRRQDLPKYCKPDGADDQWSINVSNKETF